MGRNKKNNVKNLSRRNFISKSAQVAAALPLFHILRPSIALGAGSPAPLRVIFIQNGYQYPDSLTHPINSAGAKAKSGTDFNLNFTNSSLSPFSKYQSKVSVVRGLKYGDGIVNSHHTTASIFSGFSVQNAVDGGNPVLKTAAARTLDQYLYDLTKLVYTPKPVYLGIGYNSGDTDHSISFVGSTPQRIIGTPGAAYDLLLAGASSSGTQINTNDPAKVKLLQNLKLVQNSVSRLIQAVPKVSSAGNTLTSHGDALNALIAASSSVQAPVIGCSPPTRTSVNVSSVGGFIQDSALLNSYCNGHFTVLANAMSCDKVRFASIKLQEYLPGKRIGMINGNWVDEWHTDVSHLPDNIQMSLFKNYWSQQVVNLMDKLNTFIDPLGDGKQTLLDNTLIVYGSGGPMFDGPGNCHLVGEYDLLFVLAGGAAGQIKMGQFTDVRASGGPGQNVNALLANVVNAVVRNNNLLGNGLNLSEINQLGDFSFSVDPRAWLGIV